MIWKEIKTGKYLEAYEVQDFSYFEGNFFVHLKGRKYPMHIALDIAEELDLTTTDFIAFTHDPDASETFDANFVVWREEEFKRQHELIGTQHSGAIH